MDIRGIEVTNQLRSAIRAKLLELGVRYDEELPDYILVMVVNKKSRQQMHDDLHLFLEDCTTPFVDWLDNQVLKKLQKVTVAKKKSAREFVPTVVVKQEEERKKKKISATSFLEDQAPDVKAAEKPNTKTLKDDKVFQKQGAKSSVSSQKIVLCQNKNVDKSVKPVSHENITENSASINTIHQEASKKSQQNNDPSANTNNDGLLDVPSIKPKESHTEIKVNEPSLKTLKRPLDATTNHVEHSVKKQNEAKRSKVELNNEDIAEENARKLKSCVNKPKITSVVSVKSRLGISPRKKFETYRGKGENERGYRQAEKRFEKHRFDNNRINNFQRARNFDADERTRRNREGETKHGDAEKVNDIKTRLGHLKSERVAKTLELKEKQKLSEKTSGIVKTRLGVNAIRLQRQETTKSQELSEFRRLKCLEQDRDPANKNKNIKNRLGPLKNNFRPTGVKSGLDTSSGKRLQSSDDEDCLNLGAEEELDDESQLLGNNGSLKSHIIAVNKSLSVKTERKRLKSLEKSNKEVSSDGEEEFVDAKIPSKVIVTPRPLKPLQPTQKRATQSLLLRAVAEANQSVVTQKNPEPSLLEKKPVLKRLKPAAARDVGQNLSVHFNASKRLVMEKIQVELNTVDVLESESKPYVPHPVTEEHMGVVMSLFQRSDDNQKFLVTLNGYNNNLAKEKTASDDDERLEMEVNEEDELAVLTTQNDSYMQNESESTDFRITDTEDDTDVTTKERTEENNENCNTENVEKIEEIPRKRRKLSPIVYNRSHSPSPIDLKSSTVLTNSSVTKRIEKKPSNENTAITVIDKSREKCRYWPNCTLGNKCAYLHPPVMCSAFPACKFGEKCAYRHPKCKFGLSCTKLGCVFSHPAQQCKYHPFCTKPSCPYSHPATNPTVPVEATSQRAKFTWRRRD